MDSVSRRLESAIRQMDRRLRESGGDDQVALEAAREELNAVLDEAAYSRRPQSPAATSALRNTARRLSQVERQLDTVQPFHSLQEEIRWVDEEASQARKELEDRLEARIVAIEARVTALVAVNNETDAKVRELERRAEVQETMAKRHRLTMEELADKVSQVVSDLQQKLLNPPEEAEVTAPLRSQASTMGSRDLRPHSTSSSRMPVSKSEAMVRELMNRVEALEGELEGERERSVRAVELVANALTPTRRTASNISPEHGLSAAPQRRSSSSSASRRLPMDEYAPPRNGESGSKRYYS